jgi:GDSL-like Lipase/Acylhydrolase family
MAARRGEILLLVLGLVLALVAGEVTVRVLSLATPRPLGYAPVDTDGRERRPINREGYRDRERAVEKAKGARRVVLLGDSFTWGASVLFDDTYGQRLERWLNDRRGEPWEVVSLAVPGMNTVGQATQLENEGFAYGPDVVVLGYVLNDSEDESAAEARRAADWLADRTAPPSRPLLDRSALIRVVRSRLWATTENRRRVEGFRSMYAPSYSGWVAAQKALRAMGGACRQRGVPFVVLVFPLFGSPLDDGYPFTDLHARVARAAAEAGAKVVDLLPFYRGLRSDLLVVDGTNDEHPNEIAHRIAAQTLRKGLEDVLPAAVSEPEPERPARVRGTPGAVGR